MLKKIFFSFKLNIFLISFLFFKILNSAIDNFDTTFNSGTGYVTTQNAQGFTINKIRLQSNGKIVAVGFTQNQNTQAILARYNTDGTLDNTFGSGGIVTGAIGSSLSTTVITDAAIQADGSIVVSGYNFDTNTSTKMFVARYSSTGTLDNTFGTNGIVTFSFGSGVTIFAMALQGDEKIVVAGTTVQGNTQYGIIVRFTTAGVLDTTFNSVGYVTPLLGIRTALKTIAINGSGNIIVAGYYNQNGLSGDQFVMARYTSAGALDTTFNNPNGFVTGSLGTRTMVNCMTLDGSSNILVGGVANDNSPDKFFVARYTSSGTLDTTFNNPNGYISALVGTASQVNDIKIQSDGKIVVGGVINYDFAKGTVARYNSNGTTDTTFINDGVYSLTIGNGTSINSIAIQSSDDRVVVGGYETDPTTSQPFGLVARFNKNDTDFVNLTSIADNSTINTKIPTISGTSSAASASVQVLINGVSFGTFSTDGSGNWSAGTSSVLPAGTNTIQTNLIVSASTIVSHLTKFTVVDYKGEDSVLAYSTATQTLVSANTATTVTFNNLPLTTTWTNNGSDTLTCNATGRYQITYNLNANNTDASNARTISSIIAKNNVEIPGSQSGQVLAASDSVLITNTITTNLNSGDTIKLQYAGSTTNVRLASAGIGTTLISAKINIIRLS